MSDSEKTSTDVEQITKHKPVSKPENPTTAAASTSPETDLTSSVATADDKFKVPRSLKLDLNSPTAPTTSSSTPLLSPSLPIGPSSSDLVMPVGSTKLDKTVLSNLNKSLKVKQKIISTKEPQPKNISEIVNRSPQASTFPGNITGNPSAISSTNDISESVPNLQLNEDKTSTGVPSIISKKPKKIPKQNSTRTDIFAAKLASAVDDVDSSDSDETFVYEHNINEDYNNDEINDINQESEQHNDNNTPSDDEHNNDDTTQKPENEDQHDETAGNGSGELTTILPGPSGQQKSDLTDLPSLSKPADDYSTKDPVPKKAASQGPHNGSFNGHQLLDGLINKNLRPPTQRTLSNRSVSPSEDNRRPVSPFNNSSYASSTNQGYGTVQYKPNSNVSDFDKFSAYQDVTDEMESDSAYESDNETQKTSRPFQANDSRRPNSTINGDAENIEAEDTNVETEDDDIDVDDISSHDSFTSSKNMVSSSTTAPQKSGHKSSVESTKKVSSVEPTNSITSKKKRSVTSSSKLRSTTSKLFDKKGSQPRRYSIIPDDLDIEDFDDELIYYDNVRFPHNGNNTNNNSLNFNENSPLINPRIPHYRSLNLNPQNLRRMNKTKRYLSTGQQISTNPGSPTPHRSAPAYANANVNAIVNTGNSNGTNNNSDIFPFPYPEQPNNQAYYFGFDNYDEETGSINENQYDKPTRKQSGMFSNHHLSNSNNHFLLPRKNSFAYSNYGAVKKTVYTMISIISILSVGFLFGFFIASTKDLSNVAITDVQSAVVSQDELIFNIVVEAVNPGWFTIGVKDVELDIFARSGYLPPSEMGGSEVQNQLESAVETVLLGTIHNLETEMTFEGVILHKELIQQVGEVKLLQPGKNLTNAISSSNDTVPDNSAKWAVISKSPFDLIVKGVLKYNLPLSSGVKSVVVTKTSYIDPNAAEGERI